MFLQKLIWYFPMLCTIILKHISRETVEELELEEATSLQANENGQLSRSSVSIHF